MENFTELFENLEADIYQLLIETNLFSKYEAEEIVEEIKEYLRDALYIKLKDLDRVEYSNFEYFEV